MVRHSLPPAHHFRSSTTQLLASKLQHVSFWFSVKLDASLTTIGPSELDFKRASQRLVTLWCRWIELLPPQIQFFICPWLFLRRTGYFARSSGRSSVLPRPRVFTPTGPYSVLSHLCFCLIQRSTPIVPMQLFGLFLHFSLLMALLFSHFSITTGPCFLVWWSESFLSRQRGFRGRRDVRERELFRAVEQLWRTVR